MLFRGFTLVLPDRLVPAGSLRTRNGRIETVAVDGEPLTPEPGEVVIEGNGTYLAPGFVDGHVHGGAGRDTMEGTDEAFAAVLAFHAGGGTTAAALRKRGWSV